MMKWCLLFLASIAIASSQSVGDFFLTEHLGRLESLHPASARQFLSNGDLVERLGLRGNEVFEFRKEQRYRDVVRTYRFDQTYNGLPVNGGEIALHVNPTTLRVEGVTASVVLVAPAPEEGRHITNETIADLARELAHKIERIESLSLEYVSLDGEARLCWRVRILSHKRESLVRHIAPSTAEPATLYIDALTHKVVMDIPVFQKQMADQPNRDIFDAQQTETLPGVQARSEGGVASSDVDVNDAYDNSGDCWGYYYSQFGRNSYDNQGAQLISTVHYGVAYNNAFWNGEQMVYGDGDGTTFHRFDGDATVVCHELTHAVTSSTSNLRYFAQSGALNEAFSDIMGISSVILKSHVPDSNVFHPSPDWIVGGECVVGDLFPNPPSYCLENSETSLPPGLRFMDNPTCDGTSTDDFETRYRGFQDNGGVHWNSGIANLAYQLTVDGGHHPRGVTDITVTGIGMEHAQQIYYMAFTQFLKSTSDFAEAKTATIRAAELLYGPKEVLSVSDAWSAVNVN